MPSFDGATEWINGEVKAESLKGKPTIIHVWAVSCYICKNNMPTLLEWKKTYGDSINFVGVHRPRQESDMTVADVRAAVETYGLTEPVAIDNTHEVGDRFETGQYWPYYFLFDADGKMKSRAAGDVGLAQIEKALVRLVAEDAVTA
jgi:thiol-disulfide isomerase/thioredoxin